MKLSKASLATFKGIFIASAVIMLAGSPAYADADIGEAYFVIAKFLHDSSEPSELIFNYRNDYHDNFIPVMSVNDTGDVFAIGQKGDGGLVFGLTAENEWIDEGASRWSDMLLSPDGDIYVTGSGIGMKTRRYDSSGELLWEIVKKHHYGAVLASHEDAFYATGHADSDKIYILKFDRDGDVLWERYYQYQVGGYLQSFDATVDDQENIYIVGQAEVASGSMEFITIKYDSDGDLKWAVTDDGESEDSDQATSVAVDHAGFAYVAGISENYNCYAMKYDQDGSLVWNAEFVPPTDGIKDGDKIYWVTGATIKPDDEGNVYMYGACYPNSDYYLIKYNSDGELLWSVPVVNNLDDGYAMTMCPDGSLVVPGAYGIGYSRFNTDGELIESGNHDPAPLRSSRNDSVAVDSECNVYVGGSMWDDYDDDDSQDDDDDDAIDDDAVDDDSIDDDDDDDESTCCGL